MKSTLFAAAISFLIGSAELQAAGKLAGTSPSAVPPAHAVEMLAGISYQVLKPAPASATTISAEFAQYRLDAWSADGILRIDARADGTQTRPVRMLAQAWPSLARALLVTPIGETRRWWISAERMRPAYSGAPAQAHVLDLTVIGNADPMPVPKDVGAPPPDVEVTASGLAYKVLKRGGARDHPQANSVIEIDYSGWTRDGKLFDSSVLRGERARFPLTGLIAGWKEGMLLMSPGDSFRFWIPGHLAYDSIDKPGAPKGMLVFDITLVGYSPATP